MALKEAFVEYSSEKVQVERPGHRPEIIMAFPDGPESVPAITYLKFLEALELENPTLEDLNSSLVRSYSKFLGTVLLEPHLIRACMESMRSFCIWCFKRGYTNRDLSLLIEVPAVLPLEEIRGKVLPFGKKNASGG